MTELSIRPEEIRDALDTFVQSYEPGAASRVTKEYDLRAYTCAELTALLARHGLEVRSVWGGADRSDYSAESRRLVLLALRG